jgi:hypothetical protein
MYNAARFPADFPDEAMYSVLALLGLDLLVVGGLKLR